LDGYFFFLSQGSSTISSLQNYSDLKHNPVLVGKNVSAEFVDDNPFPGWSNRMFSAAAASEGLSRTQFGTSKVQAMREQSWRPVSPSWQANGQTKRYVYDGEDILLEYDGTNTLQARYTHGPGIDEPIAVTKGGSTFFYHQDGLGTVTDLTDSAGATAKSYSYDA
jgi:hypothetical protein